MAEMPYKHATGSVDDMVEIESENLHYGGVRVRFKVMGQWSAKIDIAIDEYRFMLVSDLQWLDKIEANE